MKTYSAPRNQQPPLVPSANARSSNFRTIDIVEYSGADVAKATRSDEHQSGVLAVSLCLDSRHEGVIEDLECAEWEVLAANDKRRRAAVASIFGQHKAVRAVAVLRIGHGYRPAAAVTMRI